MGLVPFTVRRYTALTIDEDTMQEGYIGLWNAALHFDGNDGTLFPTFAVRCIQHQLWNREKRKLRHDIPNQVSLSEKLTADTDTTYMELLRDPKGEEHYLDVETADMIERTFTEEEKAVIRYRLKGVGVWTAGKLLGRSGTWADTRIKRIKKKLIEERNE